MKCTECKTNLLTMSTYVSDWDADKEPYETGKSESHDGVNHPLYINAVYCERCQKFDSVYFEADMINKLTIEARYEII